MIRQLRIYQIDPRLLPEFDARFKDHAHRIMKSYGFDIESMGYSRVDDRVEFIYILRWDDVNTMQAQWAAFMADAEWESIKILDGCGVPRAPRDDIRRHRALP